MITISVVTTKSISKKKELEQERMRQSLIPLEHLGITTDDVEAINRLDEESRYCIYMSMVHGGVKEAHEILSGQLNDSLRDEMLDKMSSVGAEVNQIISAAQAEQNAHQGTLCAQGELSQTVESGDDIRARLFLNKQPYS